MATWEDLNVDSTRGFGFVRILSGVRRGFNKGVKTLKGLIVLHNISNIKYSPAESREEVSL